MVLPYLTCQISYAYFIYPLDIDAILKSALYLSCLYQHTTGCCLASSLYTNLNVKIPAWAAMAECSWVTSSFSWSSLFWTLPIHLISRNGYKEQNRNHEPSEQGNDHNHLRDEPEIPMKDWSADVHKWHVQVEHGRALLPVFPPSEDSPALGRAQSPAYIRLRQVTAPFYKNLLCTMAFQDYTFWEEGDKKRRITRREKSPTEHYSLLFVLDALDTRAPGTGELSGNTEKIIILESLPRRLDPGLPSWSFHASLLLHRPVLSHAWLPPWGTVPMYQLAFMSPRTGDMARI